MVKMRMYLHVSILCNHDCHHDHGYHPWSGGRLCGVDPPKWPGVFVTAGTIFGAPGGSHSWGIATARARNGSWRDCTCHLGGASFSETLKAHPKTWIRLQEF